MITEDYVSFEIAKLLKEKGFDIPVKYYYWKDTTIHSSCYNWNEETEKYSRPTLQMAMKWLREVHNTFIDITVVASTPMQYTNPIYHRPKNEWINMYSIYNSYEEAAKAAIKYCLEKLI